MMNGQETIRPMRLAVRHRIRHTHEARERPLLEVPVGPRCALGMSTWFGLTVGLAELALTLALKPLSDSSPGFFRMNRHIMWTIPTVNLVLFGLCGLVLALVLRARPRWGVRCVVAPLNLLAMLTILLSFRKLFTWACLILACGLACRLTVRIEANLPAFRRLVRLSMPALAAGVLGLVAFSLGGHMLRERRAIALLPPVPSGGSAAPNVLLVVLDTVRADHLSLYGYGRDTTPNLTRLARRGIRFEQARSTAPWTLPSHASMMTGRWPHQLSAGIDEPLDDTHETLAQFLAAHGYATAGFVANTTYTSAETGLDRGFARYDDHDLSPMGILWTSAIGQRFLCRGVLHQDKRSGGNPNDYHRKDAAQIRRDLLAWIEQQKDRPFFAFLNLLDAHNPYIPPADYDRHFGVKPESVADFVTLDRWFILDKKKLAPRDIQLASDAYDDCIAYLDEQLGRLFDELDRGGRLANTLVIVTADHGEHFGEHQLYGHASSLYEQEIHVPLLVFLPGGAHAGRSVVEQISLRDLPATVADVLGLHIDSPFPGRSLARHWTPSTPPAIETSLSEVDAPVKSSPNQGRSPVFRGPMKALTSGQDVYIRNGDGSEELFDLESDPMESRNLAGLPESRAILDRFRADLARFLREGEPILPRARRLD